MSDKKNNVNIWLEIFAIGLFGVSIFMVSAHLNLYERFYNFSRGHDHWELDEIVIACAAISIALIIFSFRRWNALNKQFKKQLEIEQELRIAKNKAEIANEAKSLFLANMSHEIRTPMNAIIGFCDILGQSDLSDEQKGHLSFIQKSGRNLLAIINDILDFSKIEANKLTLELTTISLMDTLRHIDSMMLPLAQEKEIDFKILTHPNWPRHIKTDVLRLNQCLTNLVNNAIKFTEKGHVFLIVRQETINNEMYVCFEIEDTGIGIEEDKLDAVFESFTQADMGTTRKYDGTGLGLSITKKLVEYLDGELSITSQLNKGTTVTIKLPVRAEQNQVEEFRKVDIKKSNMLESVHANQQYKGRALVVEDNHANRYLINSKLKQLGLKVDMVVNGKEAVTAVDEHQYDIVFMDMQMPVMNGYEATMTIRMNHKDLPIIALTAHALQGDKDKCFDCGCTEYLSKPIELDKLHTVLGKYMKAQSDSEASSPETDSSSDGINLSPPSEVTDEELNDVLGVFVNTLPDQIQKIEKALNNKEWETLNGIIADLSNICQNTGFNQIMDKSTEINTLIQKQELNKVISEVDELVEMCVDIHSTYQKIMD